MDDAFGNWLAGFVDGEGCFTIYANSGRGRASMACRFELRVRLDDAAAVYEIQRRTGLGTVRSVRGREERGWNPTVRWAVCSKRECAALVRIFDRYPLRAKKARDFAIWKIAVREWLTTRDQSALRACAERLRAVRAFEVTEDGAIQAPVAQLRLVK